MKIKSSLLGLFLLIVLLVAACGSATSTPEAVMDEGQSANSQEGTEAMMDDDASDSMKKEESESVMGEGDSESMKDEESEAAMDKEDSESMMEEGSEAEMEEDSDAAMDTDESESMMEEGSEGTTDKDDSESMTKQEDAAAMMDLPDWFSAKLTDVNSGEVLAVADLQGKVVLVETMAIWCSNCLRQQKEVKALHEALGMRDDLVTLVLDIDPNEDADTLKTYADKHGFSWVYAVAPER